MSQWAEIRHLPLVEDVPKREIARRPVVEAAAACIAHARPVRGGLDSRRGRLLIEVDEPRRGRHVA